MPITVPQKQQGLTSQIVPMAAGAVGQAYGGPAGGMAGQALGRGVVGNGAQGPTSLQNAAIQRRIDSMTPPPEPTHAEDIANAQEALNQMPPEMQKQYGPMLAAAQAKLSGGQR